MVDRIRWGSVTYLPFNRDNIFYLSMCFNFDFLIGPPVIILAVKDCRYSQTNRQNYSENYLEKLSVIYLEKLSCNCLSRKIV